MKAEVKPPVLIAIVVALVVAVGFLIFKFAGAGGGLDNGQVKYTPGVPPWLDKKNGANQPGGASQPVVQRDVQGASNMPPGMTPPSVGGNDTK